MHHSCYPGCAHTATATHKTRSLWITLLLTGSFAAIELAVGWISHSLALIAESGHLLSDGLALALALVATWVAQFPPSEQATFGYRRIEILAALANGLGLMAVAVWVAWEAVERLHAPAVDILSLPMLVTAAIGLGVNTLNATLLHTDSHDDLNLRGAFLHMVADAIGSIGVILAAIAVWLLHWNWADGAISLAVAALIALSAVPLVRQSVNILLEKTPPDLNISQMQQQLQAAEGVEAVSQLRVWTIALGQTALSAHLVVSISTGEARDRLLRQLQTALQQEFGIQETYLQMTAAQVEPVNLSLPARLELLSGVNRGGSR